MTTAFEMFILMKEFGLRPNDVTYNSLIDACVRCNKMQQAWSLLNEMQDQNIHPDNFTYSTLIKGIRAENQSQAGISNYHDLEKAFTLLE
jgi:pentatricopeptide repeat domain-containing protein 1